MASYKYLFFVIFAFGNLCGGDFWNSHYDEDIIPPHLFDWLNAHAFISGIEQSKNINDVKAYQAQCLEILSHIVEIDKYITMVEDTKIELYNAVEAATKRIEKSSKLPAESLTPYNLFDDF